MLEDVMVILKVRLMVHLMDSELDLLMALL